MADKSKRSKKAKRAPVAYDITVNADLNGNFSYSTPGMKDASSIRPANGDTITWLATLNGIPVPFQVEFPGFSPFGPGNRVVRSLFNRTNPMTVALPNFYRGNLVLKYTITLANGWSDDPDVEPVPSDALNTAVSQVISLSIDNNTGNLVVDQPNASFVKGQVKWCWAGTPQDDFTVTFSAPVPNGWPPQTASQSERIVLDLETAAAGASYSIQTNNLGLSKSGLQLTIT